MASVHSKSIDAIFDIRGRPARGSVAIGGDEAAGAGMTADRVGGLARMGDNTNFTTPLMRLQNPHETKILLVTLAETTPRL